MELKRLNWLRILQIVTAVTQQFSPCCPRDSPHAVMDLLVPGFGAYSPRLSLGGSLFISAGSRPTEYYQPLIRLITPAHKHLAWYGEGRWYGFGEPLYFYEGFRTHMLTVGLRCTP